METKVKTLKEGHIICTGIGTKVEKKGTSHAHTQKSGYRSTMATERYTADTIRKGNSWPPQPLLNKKRGNGKLHYGVSTGLHNQRNCPDSYN